MAKKKLTLGQIQTVGSLRRALQAHLVQGLHPNDHQIFLQTLNEIRVEDSLPLGGPEAQSFWSDIQIELEAALETTRPFVIAGLGDSENQKTKSRLASLKRLLRIVRVLFRRRFHRRRFSKND